MNTNKNANRHLNAENELVVTRGEVKQVRGMKRYKLLVISEVSHGDEKYSTGTTINKIAMTPSGGRRSLLSPGEQAVRYRIVKLI